MNKNYKFNLRRCIFASTLSGCIQRNQSKIIISLPTNTETVELFKKALIRGFSLVNTRLAFDKNILMPDPENNNVVKPLKREILRLDIS